MAKESWVTNFHNGIRELLVVQEILEVAAGVHAHEQQQARTQKLIHALSYLLPTIFLAREPHSRSIRILTSRYLTATLEAAPSSTAIERVEGWSSRQLARQLNASRAASAFAVPSNPCSTKIPIPYL